MVKPRTENQGDKKPQGVRKSPFEKKNRRTAGEEGKNHLGKHRKSQEKEKSVSMSKSSLKGKCFPGEKGKDGKLGA